MPRDLKIRLSALHAAAPFRKKGYVEAVLAEGILNGDLVTLSENAFTVLRKKFALPETKSGKIKAPNFKSMAKTAIVSSARWIANGAKGTDKQTLELRLASCRSCEFWNSEALGGTGRCMKCGCSTWAKLRMATEKCPVGKW